VEFNNNARKFLLNFIDIESNKLLGKFDSKFIDIRNYFVNLFNKNVTKLYNKYAVLDYSKESMKFTNKIRIKTKLDYKDKFSITSAENVDRIIKMIDNISHLSTEKSISRINKFNSISKNETKLSMLISTIIKENKLTLEEKQLGIENVILNYDLD